MPATCISPLLLPSWPTGQSQILAACRGPGFPALSPAGKKPPVARSIVVRPTIRGACIVLAPLLPSTAVGVSPGGGGSVPASSTVGPAKAAAGWLARQMTNGDHFEA